MLAYELGELGFLDRSVAWAGARGHAVHRLRQPGEQGSGGLSTAIGARLAELVGTDRAAGLVDGLDPNLWTPLGADWRSVPVGVHPDTHTSLPIDLTNPHGIGINGTGAADVVRALLMGILTRHGDQPPGQVVIARADANTLLQGASGPVPKGWHLVPSLSHAMALFAEIVSRRRELDPETAARARLAVLVLAEAPTEPRVSAQLAELLDGGSALGVAVVGLGDWPPGDGVTVHKHTVVATWGATMRYLRDARLYHLPAPAARDMLILLTYVLASDRDGG